MTSNIILKECIKEMGIDFTIDSQRNMYAYRRYIFYAICRQYKVSLTEMAYVCGGRNHATAINGLKKFDDVIMEDKKYIGYKVLYGKCLERCSKAPSIKKGLRIMELTSEIRRLRKENKMLSKKLKKLGEI